MSLATGNFSSSFEWVDKKIIKVTCSPYVIKIDLWLIQACNWIIRQPGAKACKEKMYTENLQKE